MIPRVPDVHQKNSMDLEVEIYINDIASLALTHPDGISLLQICKWEKQIGGVVKFLLSSHRFPLKGDEHALA